MLATLFHAYLAIAFFLFLLILYCGRTPRLLAELKAGCIDKQSQDLTLDQLEVIDLMFTKPLFYAVAAFCSLFWGVLLFI